MVSGWAHPTVIEWSQLVLDSYYRWIGRQLLGREGSAEEQAARLFAAPFVLLSHGVEEDPLVNYANQAALDLWEATWNELIGMPSQRTAEPINRDERTRLLRVVTEQGFSGDYRGVRVSCGGQRFLVEGAVVWNVLNSQGARCGQAACFSRWTKLEAARD